MQCRDLKNFAQWSKVKLKINYTWFMRLNIIRFMEANLYIKPKLNDYIQEFDYSVLGKSKVKNHSVVEFRNIFFKQLNELNALLPEVFSKVSLDEMNSCPFDISTGDNDAAYYIYKNISEKYFNVALGGSVNVLGWLYEYYNLDDNESISILYKSNHKISKDKLPSVTQIFTPDWIVEYLIKNSLEKINFHSNKGLKEIRCIDPCMGCGHILTAMFDHLMKLYKNQGYTKETAANLILENNLYGIDIDERVYKLCYLSLMMKAREYNPSIFHANIRPNVCCIRESNELDCDCLKYLGYGIESKLRDRALESINNIISSFTDAREYGSLINLEEFDVDLIEKFLSSTKVYSTENASYKNRVSGFIPSFNRILRAAKVLSQKYHVVITNPPYLSKRVYNSELSNFLNENYPIGKFDLYSAFIYKCIEGFCIENGYVAMVTIHSWMFISSFHGLRRHIINNYYISDMLHIGPGAFKDINAFNALTTAFVIKKCSNQHRSTFIKLTDFLDVEEKLSNLNNAAFQYNIDQDSFKAIDGWPLVYWITDRERSIFNTVPPIKNNVIIKQGMATSDNKRFLRYWYEVPFDEIGFNMKNLEEANNSSYKWFPYNKGGNFRKWYGNNELVVNWEKGGEEIKKYTATLNQGTSARIKSQEYYFKEGITWSLFGFENFGVRYKENGYIFDISGSSMFVEKKYIYYLLSFLCSSVAFKFLTYLAPTVNFQIKNIGDLPLIIEDSSLPILNKLSLDCIDICMEEWDEYEQSWNFKRHPLLQYPLISDKEYSISEMLNVWQQVNLYTVYTQWESYTIDRFNRLKSKEEQINKIFINMYKLNNIIGYKVIDRDVSIKKASLQTTLRSLISYVIGCIAGRYSPYDEKLLAAPGGFIIIYKDKLFQELPLFIKTVFGHKYYEENIRFIAKALYDNAPSKYKKLQPIDVIKKYIEYDFIKEHSKTYKKHPIYIIK